MTLYRLTVTRPDGTVVHETDCDDERKAHNIAYLWSHQMGYAVTSDPAIPYLMPTPSKPTAAGREPRDFRIAARQARLAAKAASQQ